MAIEKVKKRKIEISPAAAAQMGISGALIVLSIIFGYIAFVKWRFKENLVSGYENFDSNDLENARKDLEDALRWKADHAGARELLAKIQCDIGQMDAAEANYNRLLDQGYAPPQVHAGLGVVFLKKADKAEAKDAAGPLKQARDCFERASGVPEAAIGLGHCDILQAERLGAPADPKRFSAALQRFRKIRDDMNARQDYRALISRWGVADYFSGLGKALAASEAPEERKEAASAFRSWNQMARRSPIPMGNFLAMETRRYEERAFTLQEMTGLKAEAMALRRETELWKIQKEAFGALKEPWLYYTLALSKAFLDAGVEAEYEGLVRELINTQGFENRLDIFLFDASMRTRRVLRDEAAGNLEQQVFKNSQSYKALLSQGVIKDESAKIPRALAHNNLGWMEAWLGSYTGSDGKLGEARNQFLDAVKIFPEDYVYNRNLCVVFKRLRRPEKEYLQYLEKAKAAPKAALAEDFARFEQYMEGK